MTKVTPIYEPLIPSPNWPAGFTFSPASALGTWFFLRARLPPTSAERLSAKTILWSRHVRYFASSKSVLALVGGSLSNIVETTDYVLSLDDYKKTAQLRRELFKGPPWPAATGVVVSGLVRPDALIEIKGIAVLG